MLDGTFRVANSIINKCRELAFPYSYKQRSLTHRAIKSLLKRDDSIIVEVGAADGLDTAKFLQVFQGPGFRIIAIEPDPRNIIRFRQNISDVRATLIEAACSDTNGYQNFHLSSTEYSSSLKRPNMVEFQKYWPEISFTETITIDTRTLDSIVLEMELSRIDFIWADVQGAEDLLISGSHHSLQRTRFFYSEYGGNSLYANDVSLDQIMSLLGPSWSLLYDYGTDALFVNHEFGARSSC